MEHLLMLAGHKFAKTYLEVDVEIGAIIHSIRSNHKSKPGLTILGNPDKLILTLSCSYY